MYCRPTRTFSLGHTVHVARHMMMMMMMEKMAWPGSTFAPRLWIEGGVRTWTEAVCGL